MFENPLFTSRQVVALPFRIREKQVDDSVRFIPVVNDAHATAFAFATLGLEPPKLPQATRSRDEISSFGAYDERALERRVLRVAEQLRNLPCENGRFKELELQRYGVYATGV